MRILSGVANFASKCEYLNALFFQDVILCHLKVFQRDIKKNTKFTVFFSQFEYKNNSEKI